jgi:hypothetical protein
VRRWKERQSEIMACSNESAAIRPRRSGSPSRAPGRGNDERRSLRDGRAVIIAMAPITSRMVKRQVRLYDTNASLGKE